MMANRSVRLSVSINELSALLRRCFEGIGFTSGDYVDAARTCIWLETHGFHGIDRLMASWQQIVGSASSTLAIISTEGDSTNIDASNLSMMVHGQKILDLGLAKLAHDNPVQLVVQGGLDSIAIAAGLANLGAADAVGLAYWCDDEKCYTACSERSHALPRIEDRPLGETATEDLHLLLARSTDALAAARARLDVGTGNVQLIKDRKAMMQSLNNCIIDGITIDAGIWQQLNSAADAVLVTATEQSRRGAGA